MNNSAQNIKFYYLYCITNLANNKIYIGQTVQPHKRWNQHRNDAAKPTMIIHHAINKYGALNFTFEIIAVCISQDDANELETQLVSQYNSLVPNGYNATHGGMNAPKTEEWKKIISKKARARAPITSQQMKQIAANRAIDYYDIHKNNTYNLGLKHTDEWKERMSKRVRSEEEKAKQSKSLKISYALGKRSSYFRGKIPWNKGKKMPPPPNKIKWTDEQIEAIKIDTRSCREIGLAYNVNGAVIRNLKKSLNIKLQSGNTGRIHSDETKIKISQAIKGKLVGDKNGFYGKSHSAETVEKNKLAHLGKCKFTNEQILEMKRLFTKNVTMKDIAIQFNCSSTTIKRMLDKVL